MPKNSGMNTTQENNFQAGWLEVDGKINFKKSVQKNFQAKRPLTPVRINLKKSVSAILAVPFWQLPFWHATFGGVGHFVMPPARGYEWGGRSLRNGGVYHPPL
jgi:hypothetical protein